MPGALRIIFNQIPGHGPSDAGNLPCSGIYGRAMGMAARPPCGNKNPFLAKGFALKCSSERKPLLCRATPNNNQRRNPRQNNRQGFSQNRNRQNEHRETSDQLEEPDYLSSKNGLLLSFSSTNKNQVTAAPGPREREIVELFRKVQAQLREKAAAKDEKKFEVSKGQNKGSETVDSLLKLLRKHSVEQGKRKVNGGNVSGIEVNFEQPGQVRTFDEDIGRSGKDQTQEDNTLSINDHSEKVRTYAEDKGRNIKDQIQEDNTSSLSRPTSNFKRRSPVPRVRYEPIISSKETKVKSESDPEPEIALVSDIDAELEHETELESSLADADVAGKVLKVDETIASEDVVDYDEEEEEEKPAIEHQNLDAMKLQDLRALAKSRGIRRYSKLKKFELIGLLNEDAV